MEVPENGQLSVSYIGYQPIEISLKNKSTFHIQLKEDTQLMDEVVVIGFGTQKKVNLTGAFISSRAAGKAMIKQKSGSIILTASMSGHIVNIPQYINYILIYCGILFSFSCPCMHPALKLQPFAISTFLPAKAMPYFTISLIPRSFISVS